MELMLYDNMLDDNGLVIFEADIPYTIVKKHVIVNENGIAVRLEDIWVEYRIII